jgi:transcriptional regulator with XRE-family HTH domain
MAEQESWRNVGKRIRIARKENGLTIRQLAAGCGLSSNAISLVERGEVAPTVLTLCKIAHALGVSASSLFQEACATQVVITRADAGQYPAHPETILHVLSKKDVSIPAFLGHGTRCSGMTRLTQMILCIGGSIEYEVGEQSYCLNPGDSLTLNGEAFHRCRNSGPQTGIAVMVLTPCCCTDSPGE